MNQIANTEHSIQHLVPGSPGALCPADRAGREIIEYGQITSVPMMPACIHGVINLRGAWCLCWTWRRRFGMERTAAGKHTCIVIIELELNEVQQRIGLVVDAVDAVLDIEGHEVEPAPPFGTGIRTDFIAGMARNEQGFTIILDVRRVLSLDDILQLNRAHGAGRLK